MDDLEQSDCPSSGATTETIGNVQVCVVSDSTFQNAYFRSESAWKIDKGVEYLSAILSVLISLWFVILLVGHSIKRHRNAAKTDEQLRDTVEISSLTASRHWSLSKEEEIPNDVRFDPEFTSFRIDPSDVMQVRTLAHGNFAMTSLVYLGDKQAVMKKVSVHSQGQNRDQMAAFMDEIRVCAKLEHPKVVGFLGIMWASLSDLSAIVEYAQHGSLAVFLKEKKTSRKVSFTWMESSSESPSKLSIALQVSEALVYLQSFAPPIIHGHLKADSLLLGSAWEVKLNRLGYRLDTSSLSIEDRAWTAPEVLTSGEFDEKSDVYSFGVVMSELDRCKLPFSRKESRRTVKAMPIQDDPTDTPDELTTMDANFPGYGAFMEIGTSPTSATLSTGGEVGKDADKYNPGQLHAARINRRLEVTKSTDMQKLETFFGLELETDITKLPTKYQHDPIPWPASYWPVYADSINYRWAKGKPSPAEKYANAFGYDAKELMDKISAKNGIDSQTKRKNCTDDAVCKALKDGSVCAKREGKTEGHCIPTWFGICHAWAPAAILEAEPACAVERNGTVFEPYDIKGLITLAYDGSKIPTIFTGSRFNGNDNAPNNTDQYGRFFDDRRRDISPGYFHVAVTNIMGRFNHSFVVDITAGNEVWNQPARSYEILRLSWTTPTAAAKKYFDTDKYPFNDAATKIAVVTTRFSWIVESGTNGPLVSTGLVDKSTTSADYEYILETDETYQILGGEWLSGSKANHPDFLWLPASKPDNSTVTSVGLHYAEIEALLDESTSSSGDCKAVSQTSTAAPAPASSTESSAAGSAPAASGDGSAPAPESGDGSAPAPESGDGSAPAPESGRTSPSAV
ncbi:TKL protein kinase [Phytophthora nicotianae INRA-310]|uniref:TKL protein kinase n=1 Tax=Phytophthora nicotianae (strain INRA-310) TaxID=761204 RepID=W2PEJ0_PHYN3|nr:TKL protein kinase [Phytophthora nicotianae INRA-310]ETM98409.1 TKL protein kinase [Phytophthora nicotianae INRA-310]